MTTNQSISPTSVAIGAAVVVTLGFLFFGSSILDFFAPQKAADDQATLAPSSNDKVMIGDVQVGTGAEAVPGSTVSVNYVGMLENGQIFDASDNHGGAFSFTLGAGQVIPGWEQGIAGMKVGGKRHLVIPPSLAYGPNGYGPIPGNATLVFDVELVSVTLPAK